MRCWILLIMLNLTLVEVRLSCCCLWVLQIAPNVVFSKVMVPPWCILNGGTVPPRCILDGGTVPPWCILNGGTAPPFNLFLKKTHGILVYLIWVLELWGR